MTGWWWTQSAANPSPCYFANIRVICEKNSERAAKSVKKTCGTGISLILHQFDIREEQGGPHSRNTERAYSEPGRGQTPFCWTFCLRAHAHLIAILPLLS